MKSNKLVLQEKNRLIIQENELATVMDTFFDNITKGIHVKKNNESSLNSFNYQNINDVLEKSKNHASVYEVRQTFMTDEKFSFKFVTDDLVKKEIMNLDGSKTTPNGDIQYFEVNI